MRKGIFEQNGSIGLYCLETNGLPVLDSNKWHLVGKIVELMSKFEEIAKRLSKRESIVSDIITNIRFIKIYMTKAALKGTLGGLKGPTKVLQR